MSLSEVAIKRPVFTTMVTLGILALGLIAASRLGTDLYPDVTMPVVTVTVPYPGAGPGDVERQILKPIEDAVISINRVDRVNAFARDNVGVVVITFKMDAKLEVVADDVRERVSALTARFPSGAEEPIVTKVDIGAAPILVYSASADLPSDVVRKQTEDQIKPALERIPGVAKVEVMGGREREIQVELDATRLESFRLSPMQVLQKLKAENVTIPAGEYETGSNGETSIGVRTMGELQSVESIAQVAISMGANGAVIRLGDVATVVDGFAEERTVVRANGQEAVAFQVIKVSGSNTVAVSDAVKEALDKLELPPGYATHLLIDQAAFIKENAHEVQIAIVFGGAMAILIILIFMMDLRSTFISALALPTAVIGTFLAMYAFGFSFNMLTLLGLSLSIGLLIDDAVVVRENIFRHLEMGEPPDVAALKGTQEIALAVLATTMTIVAVFVPVAFMDGMVGQFFRQFGLTVTAAVILSMFVAFTLDPMLSAKMARTTHAVERPIFIKRWLTSLFLRQDRLYARILRFTVNHPFITVGVALAMLFGSFGLAARIGNDFVSPEDRGQFLLNVEFPPEVSLSESVRRGQAIEKALLADGRFRTIYGTYGVNQEANMVRYRIDVGHKQTRPEGVETLKGVARTLAKEASGAIVAAENPAFIEGIGSWFPVMVSIGGPDYDVLEPTAQKVAHILRSTQGSADVRVDYAPGKRELRIVPDRELSAAAGLPMMLLGYNVRIAMQGELAGTLRDVDAGGVERETDIRLRLRAEDRQSPEAIARIPLSVEARENGMPVFPPQPPKVIRIGDVSKIEGGIAPSRIRRENRSRTIVVSASAVGRPLGNLFAEVEPQINAAIPKGYTVEYLGNIKDMRDSNQSFNLAFALAILFIYLVLASQFESFIHPMTIMLSLPLALIGALVGLYLYGAPLSMGSNIGIMLLMGLVTKNAILLVDSALQFQREGLSAKDAVLLAGPRRLRPILMTSAAMVLGMLPTALSTGSGSEFRAPMAIAVIGGVISSTLLTLLVVPVVYLGVERLRQRLSGRSLVASTGVLPTALLLVSALSLLSPTQGAAAEGETDARTITLDIALDAARLNNPDLTVAAARLSLSEVDVKRAWANFLPQLKAEGALLYYDEETKLHIPLPAGVAAAGIVVPDVVVQVSPELKFQAQLTQPLLNLPGYSALTAARQAVRAEAAIVEFTESELRLAVVCAYLGVQAADETKRVAHEAIAHATELQRVSKAQLEAQVITELAVLRAGLLLTQARQLEVRADGLRSSALAGLRRLTGLEGPLLLQPVSPDVAPPEAEATLVSSAAERRADLKAAAHGILALEALDENVWSRYAPLIAGQATVWHTNNDGMTGKATGGTVGLVASWSLYDGGQREATTQTYALKLASARAQRDSLVRKVTHEIRQSRAELITARETAVVASEGANLARRALALSQAHFAAGTATHLEVSQANTTFIEASAGLAQAHAAVVLQARVLDRAVGR